MDFSSLNPVTSNALNLSARHNNVRAVTRLLTKMNPNCIDNRGWTCLHEAAANDSFESMMLILQHPDCRPLAESHEGHTALYLACRYANSLKTIEALLESTPDIANYGSTEQVTPLHITSCQGRIDASEMLIKYGAMIDVQDFDGDTPLHDAAGSTQPQAVNVLLHAGADPEIKNESSYTPLHLACYKGCFQSVKYLVPFITDINVVTCNGDTALHLATIGGSEKIVKYLLKNGADPNIKNWHGDIALMAAITMGNADLFSILLEVTDLNELNTEIIQLSCKPNYFNYDIISLLLMHLGPEFFDYYGPFLKGLDKIGEYELSYLTHAPLNTYLYICEYVYDCSPQKFRDLFNLFLINGPSVNALFADECPPLVFIHLRSHEKCFEEVFKILIDHGCNVDYCSSTTCENREICIPDAFLVSLQSDPSTSPLMLPYSLQCEPDLLLKFAHENNVINRMQPKVQESLLSMTGLENTKVPAECLRNTVFPLKHLTRLKIRHVLKKRKGVEKSTRQFIKTLNKIALPQMLKNYLRYY
ncbi:uncharacterized protein [Epargyreus clarus]|uniref:uncharacterized protein n=1 Tax=Epargyreus clarus TaxID=520877 RepID=UPI003C302F77